MQINPSKKTTATERILQFIDYKGITKYEFHKKNGFSNGFLDKSRSIRTDKCEKILEHYPEINPKWLITGKGSMLLENKGEVQEAGSKPTIRLDTALATCMEDKAYLKEQIDIKDRQISIKDKQIEAKDQQIAALIGRVMDDDNSKKASTTQRSTDKPPQDPPKLAEKPAK